MAALFLWTVLGGLVGAFAKSVFWYETSQSWFACLALGVAGGIAGGALLGAASAFQLGSMGLSVAGAAVVLSVYGLFATRKQQIKTVDRRAA